ncbi:MAG: nitroreductase family protein [Candidatus Omnitrophica bacterium]|nr:nitroreductase family protein [Candidatus Omnitrophota bacterium]
MDKVYQIILKRRTIRRFQQKRIPFALLKKIVNGGRLAPSGANLQPCAYIVVDNSTLLDKVFATLKWAGYIAPAGNPPEGKRPTAYIIILINKEINKYGEKDAAASIENMILTALEKGIGSCWIGSIERGRLRQILKIPEEHKIDSVLALGYPDEKSVAESFKGSVKYWKDSSGVFHVPKRDLNSILHHNVWRQK